MVCRGILYHYIYHIFISSYNIWPLTVVTSHRWIVFQYISSRLQLVNCEVQDIISSTAAPNVAVGWVANLLRSGVAMGLHLGSDVGSPLWGFLLHFSNPPNAVVVPHIRPKLFPSTSLLVHYSIILLFVATLCIVEANKIQSFIRLTVQTLLKCGHQALFIHV